MKYVKIYDSKGLCTGVADIDQNYDKAGYVKLFDSNMHIIGFIDVDNIPESGADMPFVQVFDKNMQPCGVVTADNIRHSDGYLIKLQKDPSTTGSVTGGGRFVSGTSVTVVATPDAQSEYTEFDGWYEGDTKVSENASYTFTVSGARTLVAKFKEATPLWLYYKTIDGATFVCDQNGNVAYSIRGTTKRPLMYNAGRHSAGEGDPGVVVNFMNEPLVVPTGSALPTFTYEDWTFTGGQYEWSVSPELQEL